MIIENFVNILGLELEHAQNNLSVGNPSEASWTYINLVTFIDYINSYPGTWAYDLIGYAMICYVFLFQLFALYTWQQLCKGVGFVTYDPEIKEWVV